MIIEQDIAALRRWSQENGTGAEAAVTLLIEHDFWLWNDDFEARCVRRVSGVTCLNFAEISRLCDEGPGCSESQRAILRVVADLGSDRWGIYVMDGRNRNRVARAVAKATGVLRG